MNYLPLLLILFSCGKPNREIDNTTRHKPKISQQTTYKARTDTCINGFTNFSKLKVNGIDVNNVDLTEFLVQNPKYDSIRNQIIYYGESTINIDSASKSVLEIQIRDKNLQLNNSIGINLEVNQLENAFPCSYKKMESNNGSYDTKYITLYDSNFNKIYIEFTRKKIVSIVYLVDESDFDEQN